MRIRTIMVGAAVALDPAAPGVRDPSSETLSPGTVAPDCELGAPVIPSSREAQAEIRNATAKNNTTEVVRRFIKGN